ncbi:MAG: iron complex outerrane recepter protein [Verrucomicrobiota bacterium]
MIRDTLKTLGSLRMALTVCAGLPFLVAAGAYAQAPSPAAEATTERVIVTGSYIPTSETETGLPVTVYTAEVLQKQGANTPVEGLRQLPSFVGNAATENDSNAGNGQANINLRAIGPENTLTLVNGRRAFLGLGIGGPDINAIPIGALSRTEVLKDGAGAIYGSDAVAGVVNFILLDGPGEKPYEGAELFTLYGNTTDSDAHVRHVYLRGGVVGLDGKVSIAAAGEYYSRANLFSRDRTIAVTGDLSNNPSGLGLGGINNNSPTFGGRVDVNADGALVGLPTGALVLRNLSGVGRTPADYRVFDDPPGSDASRFNFRAYTPAIPAVEKAMYYVSGRYKIFGDGLQIYGDIMYSKTKQDNGLAGSPFAVGGQDSPYNPFGAFLDDVRYRTVRELGLRKSFFDNDYYRYVAAINGDFNFKDNDFISRFGYDTGFVYERFDELRIDGGDARFTPLSDEITAGNFNPFVGVAGPIVGSAPVYTIDPVTGLAVATGRTQAYDNTAAALRAAYLGHSEFYERSFLYDAKINMHLFPRLWNGGIDLAVGYEHRQDHQHSVPDPVQASGDQLGFDQAPNTKTTQEVDSVFTELGLPIITSTMNVPFARSLDITFGWRYEKFRDRDDYFKTKATFDNPNPDEDFGGAPRLTLRYQPIADVTLRASWGQSFRSPSPTELFNPVAENFPVLFDPLKGNTLQPPGGVWQGGNPTLVPEKTDSYSAGVVWTPKFLPGFSMTVDWYQLFTKDLVLSGADFAQLALTVNGNSGGTAFVDPDGCGGGSGAAIAPGGPAVGVTRTNTGFVDCIDSVNSNAGKRLVQGMDVTATYTIPTERWGQFTLTGGWNHFFTWKAEPIAGAGTHNFLGDYGSSAFPLAPGAIPFNKAFLRGEWEWRGFDFNATVNYIGDYEDDPSFILGNDVVAANPGTDVAPNFQVHRRVTSYTTLDMQLSYEWKKPPAEPAPSVKDSKDSKSVMQTEAATASIWQRMLWGTRLTVGVNNAFDRNPPTVLGAFNDNYDTSLYSIRNRYYYVSLNKKF